MAARTSSIFSVSIFTMGIIIIYLFKLFSNHNIQQTSFYSTKMNAENSIKTNFKIVGVICIGFMKGTAELLAHV